MRQQIEIEFITSIQGSSGLPELRTDEFGQPRRFLFVDFFLIILSRPWDRLD
jgi:hypothetical protein